MIKKSFLLIITAVFLLAGCFKHETVPVLEFPGKENMTIAEFQKFHQLDAQNVATLIEEDIIITGVVTSTDQFGSSYKEIYFQDETGGLCIRTSNTSYFTKYRIGQKIYVKAQGLYLQNYASGSRTGFYQLGLYGGEGGTQFLSANVENLHVFRSGIPSPIAPKIIKNNNDLDLPRDYHTLVKLVNCHFRDTAGRPNFFVPNGTLTTISQPILFNSGSGNGVEARISKYCTFANDTLPVGALNITGILTKFTDGTPQLIVCSMNDIEILPKIITLKEFDMNTNPFAEENGWTINQIVGETAWTYFPSGRNVRIQPQSGNETECWLISPKFNFSGQKDIALFLSYRISGTVSDENAQLFYTVNGGDTWVQFLDFSPRIGSVNDILMLDNTMATNPNLQIAFKYNTTDQFPIWAITNVAFKANVQF